MDTAAFKHKQLKCSEINRLENDEPLSIEKVFKEH